MTNRTTSQQHNGQPAEIYRNRTCRDIGHDWRKTAADNYRVCQRDGCHAAQRLVDSWWMNVQQAHPWWRDARVSWQEQQQQQQATPQQQSLFS